MNTSNPSALKGNLKSLVATGGVLAGAGAASQAAIVYTDLATDLTVSAGSTIFFSLTTGEADTTGAFTEQFQLSFRYAGAQEPRIQGVANSGAAAGYGGEIAYASRLSGGTTIDSGLAFSSDRNLAYYASGQWNPGDRGYLGLSFNNAGTINYGWADVSYNVNSLTLYGFAYDDSGASINAGQITAVPEPATTGAIAALFAGSLAAFEVRRRRKAARQAERIAV